MNEYIHLFERTINMWDAIIKLFDSTDKVSLLISSIATLIAAISTIVAIIANIRSNRQYKKSIEPQLSMHLVNFNNMLYLQVKNTGKTVARNISLIPCCLTNNGDNDEQPRKDGLFAMQFELYPDEVVQTEVCRTYNTILTKAFPQLELNVSYQAEGVRKQVVYQRTVTFAPAYDNKIVADVNLDLRNMESSISSISRSAVRTANYLDGCQVAPFDELNILANKSLENDLRSALGKEKTSIKSRGQTIDECVKGRAK